MKFCIGMMYQNEKPWLALHLPVLLAQVGVAVAGFVFLDGGSEDGSEDAVRQIMQDGGYQNKNAGERRFALHHHPYRWPSLAQHNVLVELCEQEGYEAMLKLDPDELMFGAHIAQIHGALADGRVGVSFPTFHFSVTRRRYYPFGRWYPDPHTRAWRLNMGVRHIGAFHSRPNLPELGYACDAEDPESPVLYMPHMHLYHYGAAVPAWKMGLRAWRGTNVNRVYRGEGPPLPLPEGWEQCANYPEPALPFTGPQPLLPETVSTQAPWDAADPEIYIPILSRMPEVVTR